MPGSRENGYLGRMGEAREVADMTGVCLNTGGFIRINTETDSCRSGNDSGDHRLGETRQRSDQTSGNTASGADARTSADFVADKDNVTHDDIEESGCLHNADEKQNAGHIRDHGVQPHIDHLPDCHRSGSRDRVSGDDGETAAPTIAVR